MFKGIKVVMCIAVISFRPDNEFPVLLGFNRDELYSRQWKLPGFHWDNRLIFAGLDIESNGTWLGINRKGFIIAVLNKEMPSDFDKDKLKSRGELAISALNCGSLNSAVRIIGKKDVSRYRAFNLLVIDRTNAFCLSNYSSGVFYNKVLIERLPKGFSMISKTSLNDFTLPRIEKHFSKFKRLEESDDNRINFENWKELLTKTKNKHKYDSLIIETDKGGTNSVSIIGISIKTGEFYWKFLDRRVPVKWHDYMVPLK